MRTQNKVPLIFGKSHFRRLPEDSAVATSATGDRHSAAASYELLLPFLYNEPCVNVQGFGEARLAALKQWHKERASGMLHSCTQ